MTPLATTPTHCFGRSKLTTMLSLSLSPTWVTTISGRDSPSRAKQAVSMPPSPPFPTRHAWRWTACFFEDNLKCQLLPHVLSSIQSQSVLGMANGNAVNWTQEPNTVDVKLGYTETRSKTLNSSTSLTNIQTGIPFMADRKIEISGEVTKNYRWGKTEESTTEVETVYKVTMPPMTIFSILYFRYLGSTYSTQLTLNVLIDFQILKMPL